MIPELHIAWNKDSFVGHGILVTHQGHQLADARDISYESSDATAIVEMLIEMRKLGLITLTPDAESVREWPALKP